MLDHLSTQEFIEEVARQYCIDGYTDGGILYNIETEPTKPIKYKDNLQIYLPKIEYRALINNLNIYYSEEAPYNHIIYMTYCGVVKVYANTESNTRFVPNFNLAYEVQYEDAAGFI